MSHLYDGVKSLKEFWHFKSSFFVKVKTYLLMFFCFVLFFVKLLRKHTIDGKNF